MHSRRLALAGTLLLAGGGAFLLDDFARDRADDIVPDPVGLGEQQNVKIGFGDPATFYVPPYLPADARVNRVDFEPADPNAVMDSLRGIARAFRAYPDRCLGRIIKAIFIVGSIRVDGVEAGGTYGHEWIFLAAPRAASPGTRRLTAQLGVHHETSSFLWLRDPALQRAFINLTPMGWRFMDNTADAIAVADAAAPPPETGFLSAYGATSAENDFNVYAETVFSDPGRLRNLAERIPLIARKLALVLDAYIQVDERLQGTFRRNGLLPGP
jgi:hypothetical protein